MGWGKLFSVFYFFVEILDWCGMDKAMSRRAKWIFGGICIALFVIATYADYAAGK